MLPTRPIGSLRATIVGLGCNNFGWRIGAEASSKVVQAALDAGINFFDTADSYGRSEEYLGRSLQGRRSQVLIATKFGVKIDEHRHGAKPEYVIRAAEGSLRRLGTDYIDLYQLHEPDPDTPIADTLGALNELVRAGKVREIGCSNFSARRLREAEQAVPPGATKFTSVQNHYSVLHRASEAAVIPECTRQGMAFLPYFPLENGLLTGKYRRGLEAPEASRMAMGFMPVVFTPENLEIVERLIRFAESREHTLLDLAVSWLLTRPVVASVIAGARLPAQVKANSSAANWKLTESDLDEIDRIARRC